MKLNHLIRGYLKQGTVMQLATVLNGQPWVCSVYYVADGGTNIYWLSFPTRRHSKEIASHNRVAITVAVKTSQPVVGVHAEGLATIVDDHDLIQKIMELYVAKYDVGKKFYENFVVGKNQHVLYKLTPTKLTIFDEANFPDDGRQEQAC